MEDNNTFREYIAKSPITDSIVVKAGPGSGKTTLLIERLKYVIVNKNNSLAGIACITYTNAAKEEILLRLQNEKVYLPSSLFIGTIHSFLLEFVVNPYSHLYNNGLPFKLAFDGLTRKYKREIGEMLNRPLHFIDNSIYNAFESLGRDEKGKPFCYRNKISNKDAAAWKRLIIKDGYIDQQDVIYLSFVILKNNKHIRDAFSSRFPYFLIDEYQDVTFWQEQLFSLLNSSFFCVGDANQSIYSFTGSQPEVFKSKWQNKSYKSFALLNNFRSTNYIIDFANKKTDIVQIGAGDNSGFEQKVVIFKDITDQSTVIQLFKLLQGNIVLDETTKSYMILARQNEYIKSLTHLLKDTEIPLDPFLGKLKTENYRCFKILQNFLIAILYKESNQLEKSLEFMAISFSYLFFNESPKYVPLSEIGYNSFMWKKLQIFTLYYLESLLITDISVADFFLKIKEFISLESKNLYNITIGTKIRILNYKWKNQTKTSKTTKLSSLLKQMDNHQILNDSKGNLYSIHSAKGLEAECVLVMAESVNQLDEWIAKNEESEEARVGYVAFSRARKLLCIWAPNINEEKYKHLAPHVSFLDKDSLTADKKKFKSLTP